MPLLCASDSLLWETQNCDDSSNAMRRGAMGLNSNPKAGVRCVPARKPKKGGTTGLRPGFPAFDGNSVTVIRWFIVFKVPKHRDIIVTANIVIIVTLSPLFSRCIMTTGTSGSDPECTSSLEAKSVCLPKFSIWCDEGIGGTRMLPKIIVATIFR